MKKLFHGISFWFNRLVHLLAYFDLWRFFPLISLNCWSLLCTPLIFLPFLLCLLTLADPYFYLKETPTAHLANRRTIYGASIWISSCFCFERGGKCISMHKGHQLCQGSSLLATVSSAPGVCVSPCSLLVQQHQRLLLDAIRSRPYLDFEDNLTFELLIMENDRLSVTENLEERLSKMCPWCQLAARQESLRGIPPSAFC